jgi:glycogen debranching enzyme
MNESESKALAPVEMEKLIGYSSINSHQQSPVEHSMVLKHNRYFFISSPHGDIDPPGHCSLGLYLDDTRVLSHYKLEFCGGPPSLLSTQIMRSFTGQVDMAIKDSEFGGDTWDPKNSFHIRREILIDDRLTERLTLTNYLSKAVDYWFELQFGCDFADIFEVRGWKREKRGEYYVPQVEDGRMTAAYRGLDGKLQECTIQFSEPFPIFDSKRARWELHMEANGNFQTEWKVSATPHPSRSGSRLSFEEKSERVNTAYEKWICSCTRWSTRITGFQDLITRAVDDIRALHIEAEGSSVISAGIPWYSTFFGRDSIITSLQTLSLNPAVARDTLHYLARHQGKKEDSFTEEQPGKIMHELRRGEMARNREIPHLPYYGTIDATPLWLILLHETWRWTGDDDLVRKLLPHAERALEWIERYGDIDDDGLYEYRSGGQGGLANQGWKDSGDGVPFPDASLPRAPIALVEVQGYVYDAKIRMAELYDMVNQPLRAEELRDQAANLRNVIISSFWMENEGIFALALDGENKQVPAISSNAAHLLWSGVPDAKQARRMGEVLLGPAMNSGWGIRTLSSQHRAFNPMSYHNGSIWPHDNAIAIMGLARYGMARAALPIVGGLYDAAVHDEFQRLPELFCGMPRARGKHPILYPVSCSPQAWASGAFFMILQAMLGIQPEAHLCKLHIRNPVLPDFLDELTIENLCVGNSMISLQFSRYRERTLANLLTVSGAPIKVQIELG